MTVTLGTLELLYTDLQMAVTMDGSLATVKYSDTQMDFYHTQWGYHRKYRGTLSDPFQTYLWERTQDTVVDGTPFWTMNGSVQKPWLYNIYRVDSTHWLGFCHTEYYGSQAPFTFALGYTSDAGNHWTYCGDIVKPYYNYDEHTNPGGVPVLVVGSYFYVYFCDYNTGSYTRRIGVARAPVADVLSAAASGTVTTWYKYASGAWTTPALTGLADNILTVPGGSTPNAYKDVHSDAAYCAYDGKYYLLVHTHMWGILYLCSSTDGVTWSQDDMTAIDDISDGTLNNRIQSFSTIASLATGATDDCRTVGSQFYVLWPRKALLTSYDDDIFYRRLVTVSGGTPTNPPISIMFLRVA